MKCVVCGSSEFVDMQVLWPELIQAWGLSSEEVAWIDRQQGTHCKQCLVNLRSQALASAIMSIYGRDRLFEKFVTRWRSNRLRVLSINTCGTINGYLDQLRGHRLVEYPEFDMTDLKIADGSYDLVLHSDSLEHVEDPVQGLRECLRVLKPNGTCIYTIPIVAGRSTERTVGKPPSYHGDSDQTAGDWMVQTEYGSDAWHEPIEAGFRSCTMHCFSYPEAFALICRK